MDYSVQQDTLLHLEENSKDEGEEYLTEISKERNYTDKHFFIFHIVCIFVLMLLMCYCFINGDIDRIIIGYDKCGNICGKENNFEIDVTKSFGIYNRYDAYGDSYISDFSSNQYQNSPKCVSEDMTHKPYLQVDECVKKCDENSLVINHRCVSNDAAVNQLQSDITWIIDSPKKIIGLCFLPLGISIIFLVLLRYFTTAYVWLALGSVILVISVLSVVFWSCARYAPPLYAAAAFSTIVLMIIVIVLIFLRDRIQLVIQLIKEASKSVTHMPLLILIPIVNSCFNALLSFLWIYFNLWIASTGTATYNTLNNKVVFVHQGLEYFIYFFNFLNFFWLIKFAFGVQFMIVAGAVSQWYFYRNKSNITNPITKSVLIMKYHVGTISIGSLLITIVYILNKLLRIMRRRLQQLSYLLCLCCFYSYIETCVKFLDTFLNYFTRNIYIVTAMRGYPFCKSGLYALNLIVNNCLQIAVLNCVTTFVFALTKILVIILSVLVGYYILQDEQQLYVATALIIVGLVAFLTIECFISIYEVAIDTLFICFCEDCEMNDGISRPYFMSKSLMEFVDNSKRILTVTINDN